MTNSRERIDFRRSAARLLVAGTLTALTGCVGIGYSTAERTVGRPPDWRASTADDLVRRWGEPDDRTSCVDGTETWVYDHSLRWAFVYVCVGVCIPLGIPVGWNSKTFHLRDGVIESVDCVGGGEVSHLCGIVPGPCTSIGCRSTELGGCPAAGTPARPPPTSTQTR